MELDNWIMARHGWICSRHLTNISSQVTNVFPAGQIMFWARYQHFCQQGDGGKKGVRLHPKISYLGQTVLKNSE